MAQANYTPISLYYSTTASAVPTAANLVQGELAINTNDGKLYYEDSSGVVQVLASKSTGSIGGSTTQVQYNSSGSLAGSAGFTFDGTYVNIGTGLASPNGLKFLANGGGLTASLNVNHSSGEIQNYANTNYFQTLYTNNTERMRITNTGNVGIGTSSPAYKLVAIDTGNAKQQIVFSDNASYFGSISHNSGTGQNEYRTEASGGHGWFIGTSSTTANMTLDSSGNLGVGTSSPASYGGSAFIKSVNIGTLNTITAGFSDEVTGTLRIAHASGQNIINFDTSNLCFQSGGSTPTERARITSSGNLLVGTTSATNSPFSSTSKFVVSGDFTGGFGQSITDTNTNTAVDHYFVSFNLGTSSGNQKGYINFVGSSGLVLYSTTSDQRLKTDLGVVTETSVIDSTVIHDYEWKQDGVKGRGVFAQEAYEIMPNAIGKGRDAKDGSINTPWGVDYSKYVPDLIVHAQQLKKQVQEQQALIESLTTRLTALESK